MRRATAHVKLVAAAATAAGPGGDEHAGGELSLSLSLSLPLSLPLSLALSISLSLSLCIQPTMRVFL